MAEVVDPKQQFVVAVDAMMQALENLAGQGDNELASLSARPVGLRDTPAFNTKFDALGRDEIKTLRRELARSIAAEKFADGFKIAMALMSIMTGPFGAMIGNLVGLGTISSTAAATATTTSSGATVFPWSDMLALFGGVVK